MLIRWERNQTSTIKTTILHWNENLTRQKKHKTTYSWQQNLGQTSSKFQPRIGKLKLNHNLQSRRLPSFGPISIQNTWPAKPVQQRQYLYLHGAVVCTQRRRVEEIFTDMKIYCKKEGDELERLPWIGLSNDILVERNWEWIESLNDILIEWYSGELKLEIYTCIDSSLTMH